MFNFFSKHKLIQFDNGKFGVIKRSVFGPEYLGYELTWWHGDDYVGKYCQFNTAEEALDAFAKVKIQFDKTKYKVISELDEWDIL